MRINVRGVYFVINSQQVRTLFGVYCDRSLTNIFAQQFHINADRIYPFSHQYARIPFYCDLNTHPKLPISQKREKDIKSMSENRNKCKSDAKKIAR